MDLIKEGKLKVDVFNSQVHFLTINEKYDIPQVERESLVEAIIERHSYYENISRENEALVAFLIQVIIDNKLRPTLDKYYVDVPEIGFSASEFKITFKWKPEKKAT